MTSGSDAPVRDVLGLPIAAVTLSEAADICESAIQARTPLLVGVVNAAKVVNMSRDPRLDAAVRTAHVIFADGMSVVWAARMLGRRLPERVAGIDLMMELFRRADRRGYRVYCLGAKQEVLDEAVGRLQKEFPNAKIVGAHHGYFTAEQEPALAESIAASKADMIFVAMTSPKKEEFLARWAERMAVPVCHGVGGSFDVIAGKVRRAPRLWQKFGMEWLYRALQEPRRLGGRYVTTNIRFVGMVARAMFSSRRSVNRVTASPLGQAAPLPASSDR